MCVLVDPDGRTSGCGGDGVKNETALSEKRENASE